MLEKPKKIRKLVIPQTELQHHIALVHWFRLRYPQFYLNFFHIPMGEYRSKAAGAKIKAMGGLKGSADLLLSVARSGYHGFYIELKVGSGRLSQEQINFLGAQEAMGYKIGTYWNWEEAKAAIEEYLA